MIESLEKTIFRGDILDTLPISIGVVDQEGQIVFFNKNFSTFLGWTLDDISTLNEWWEKAYPDAEYRVEAMDQWIAAVEEAIAAETDIAPNIYRIADKNGGFHLAEISGAFIGRHVLAIFRDVTDYLAAQTRASDEMTLNKAIISQAADGICVFHDTIGERPSANG